MHDLKLEPYRPEFQEPLIRFLADSKESMFFHSIKYLDLLADLLRAGKEHLVVLDTSGEVVGFLPLLSKLGKLGKVLNSSPYYGSNGGVLAANEPARELLLKAYNERVNSKDVAASTWIENPLSSFNAEQFIAYDCVDFRIGQFTKIGFNTDHAENLMQIFHYKTRNMVRKAMKTGIICTVENDQLPFLIETHQENMAAIGGKAKSADFFTRVPTFFEPGSEYEVWMARYEGKPIAALLLFYFRDTVEYYTPVIKEAHRDKQPLSLLIFESMKQASEKGFKLWNWGGTWASQGGVYTFKKRWGTFDQNYHYYIKLNNKEIEEAEAELLSEEYPGFFVIPFSKLLKNQTNHG